ncbi:MAG: UDP-N-acetylglucosamine 1-carboxyvinyltransferase [Patescibacteria group bacterium]
MAHTSSTSKIGDLIAHYREKRGMTQSEFAKKLKTSQSAVARMEKGEQNFSTEMLVKIGSVLKHDIITLSGDDLNLRITGGRPLKGTVTINRSKNSAVGLLCASLLNKGTTVLKKMPQIAEVERIIEVLESIGVDVEWRDNNDIVIKRPDKLHLEKLDIEAARKTRSIIMLLGPLMHEYDEFSLPQAGGCRLGTRTVRPHFFALEKFGVKISVTDSEYQVKVGTRKSADIVLYESGDTVTENAIMAAALLPGKTTIKFASANYMVQDVCYFLEHLGASIKGIGTTTLEIEGLSSIKKNIEYTPSQDPIEAMFFLAVAIVTNSPLTLIGCPIDFLELELYKLQKMGFKYDILQEYVADNGHTRLVDIKTHPSKLVALDEKIEARPFPGINIDNLPFFTLIATQAKGRTLIHDWVYEDRAVYYRELNKIGADVVQADLHRVYVQGKVNFHPAKVVCPPALRPAALILAGMLAAPGESILRNVYSINRGYEDLAQRLNKLGAKVEVLHGM